MIICHSVYPSFGTANCCYGHESCERGSFEGSSLEGGGEPEERANVSEKRDGEAVPLAVQSKVDVEHPPLLDEP